jgi:hypothetical protein
LLDSLEAAGHCNIWLQATRERGWLFEFFIFPRVT